MTFTWQLVFCSFFLAIYNACAYCSPCVLLQDMVPKYMVDKSFGKSLYSSDYDGDKVSQFSIQLEKNVCF